MKNLFDYATKELSQDAFLRWLFENYDCNDNSSLREASQYIINKLCKITDEKIIEVKTYSQWHKMDILAIVETNKRKISLFIEDKVFSSEHNNQLKKYNEIIEKSIENKGYELNQIGISKENVIKVFYKTLWLSDIEQDAVINAGWEICDILDICKIFNGFSNTDCVILKQYIEHINGIENLYKNHQIPTSSEKGIDLIKWKAYFELELLPKLKISLKEYTYSVNVTAYNYTCLCIGKKVKDCENVPYIELRSRDITNDGFSVVFLCYGVDYKKNANKIKTVDERIKTAPNRIFIPKNRRGSEPKQLARTVKANEDIIAFLKKCIQDYDYSMCEW